MNLKLASNDYESGIIVDEESRTWFIHTFQGEYEWVPIPVHTEFNYVLSEFDLNYVYEICLKDDVMPYYTAFTKWYKPYLIDKIICE